MFPIFGICLGFQALLRIFNHGIDPLTTTNGTQDVSMILNFTKTAKSSALFSKMPTWRYEHLQNKNSTANFHVNSTLFGTYEESKLLKDAFNILSTNMDINGQEFLSTIEHKNMPIYGIQWHAEANQFRLPPSDKIDHSIESVKVMQFIANFFAEEMKKSCNGYASEEFMKNQIWNYKLTNNQTQNLQEFYFD